MSIVKRKTVDNGVKKQRLTPVEGEFQLVSLLRFNLQGKEVGGCFLKKGEANYQVQFAFTTKGIHTTLRPGEVDPVFDAVESGLKDLPDGESLTIQLGSFTDDSSRQLELDELISRTPSSELKFLLMGEKARTQELTRSGLRKPKQLVLFCTYTVEPGGEGTKDVIEKAIAKLERYWKSFTGEFEEIQRTQIEQLLRAAFTDGFQNWEQLISNKMGLDIRPLSVEEIWKGLWLRFNPSNSKPCNLPSCVVLDENGLNEYIRSDIHPLSLLMESESSIPVADRRWVHVNGKYLGVLTFLDKPGGWASKNAQMRYLWEVFSRDRVFDTEIFCQIAKANPSLVKERMRSLTKQATVAAKVAGQNNSIDVKSQLNVKKTVEAQAELYEGAVPLHLGLSFLVYRDTVEELDDACRYFSSLFMRPAWVDRETEYPWRVWLQTFPLRWEKLLVKPYERRKIYLSGEAPGLMPLVIPRPCDKKGFELIAAEGGTPIFLDLFTRHRNVALFGTTRSGKSVIAAGILTQALAYGIPVSSMDYPKADGTSTFSDYTRFMGGSYFDIGKESSNLFELPDLKGLEPKLQSERFEDYKDFLLEALMTMVLGAKQSGVDRTYVDTVKSILTLAMEAFFGDVQIRDRYAKANVAGIGTPEWGLMPTLVDFVDYCSIERLRIPSASPDILKALEQVKLRLRFWLNSRVGRAISQPSTFRADAQLLVFALRNLSNDEDAAVLSLAVYSAALRRSLSSPASIFFIDESPILFEYETIAALVGRLCANGAKSGIRVILSAQDPDTISRSPSASKIFQNMSTQLVGRIQPTAIDSFANILKYPREVISRNATEAFFPKKDGLYSQWLLTDGGTYTYCRFYPGYPLLAAVANNPDESQQRAECLAKHPEQPLIGMAEFSRQLVNSIRGS